jgi:hypothetical protein
MMSVVFYVIAARGQERIAGLSDRLFAIAPPLPFLSRF